MSLPDMQSWRYRLIDGREGTWRTGWNREARTVCGDLFANLACEVDWLETLPADNWRKREAKPLT